MSWPYATSASPSSSITMFMITTGLTPLALITNYTEASDFANTTKNISEEEKYIPFSERPETYFVPIIFFFILIIGLTGNGVLALTILRHRNMRNVPNTYVLSLALGDLLVLCTVTEQTASVNPDFLVKKRQIFVIVIVTCIPFTFTVYILDSWPFGLALCKLSECAKDISIGVSVFTLTALSADRFFAIVDPMRKLHVTGSGRRATCFTAIVAGLIWVLAIICAIPASFSYLRFFQVNENISFYVRQIQARKKVAKMVMAFVIVFAVCFLPQHVFMLWFYIHPTALEDYNAFWHYFRILGFCLAYTNSCINPIALYFVSGTFRKYFDR
ncbi:Neuromedin-B receptor [Temnothorax longispinosus]|uniref:Neuromedin-B receptor n=1 Tax=Temnothorax longispinosus TaxID=300112 RepID=A0A4S2KTL2_9HYME|nr:Neuromedin-B receptor [Temnothorax longispinosus]